MAGLPVSEQELRTILVEELEVVVDDDFEQARIMARRLRVPLERALVERTRVPFRFILEQIALAWGVGFIDLKTGDVNRDALLLVPEDLSRAKTLVAFARAGGSLHVAMEDPRDRRTIVEIERKTALRVVPFLAPTISLQRAMLLYKPELVTLMDRRGDVASGVFADDTPIPALVERLLEYAIVSRASDVHIEPFELEAVVRYRVDGELQEVLTLPLAVAGPLLTRIKVLCGMRLDEKRVPQDGRFEAQLGGIGIDLRVSSLPTMFGEKIVMRVLLRDNLSLDLQNLGLSPQDHQALVDQGMKPYGMILVTGPTGSGKTTSLYALLTRVAAERRSVVNISTIEDPIEYTIPRVTQTAVNVLAGLDFAGGLRALLRQDPDVIMVGEIRDRETAEIAVRSALIGRLLLSTLHTNDAVSAVPRLLDMGIEPFLLASTLSVVVAQRLVRRLCTNCRESVPMSDLVLRGLQDRPDYPALVSALRRRGTISAIGSPFADVALFRGKGCPQCHGTGFRGRVGIFELFQVSDLTRRMIMDRRDASTIRDGAIAQGMVTLFQDGVSKALLGETTIEEIFKAAV